MQKKYITKNLKQTQKIGEKLALVIARKLNEVKLTKQSKTAVVICLHGNLGGGKTCFLQGFAKGLGIKEKILSPTFVIFRKFHIRKNERSSNLTNKYFYHFDCYRIKKPEEILELGFTKIISDPKNIVAIEWPEKIKKYLPKNSVKIIFKFIDEQTREINFKM